MEAEMIKVNASDLKQLFGHIETMKDFILCHKPYPDPEGELSDWAKNELEEARKIPDSELLSSEEVKKLILRK